MKKGIAFTNGVPSGCRPAAHIEQHGLELTRFCREQTVWLSGCVRSTLRRKMQVESVELGSEFLMQRGLQFEFC